MGNPDKGDLTLAPTLPRAHEVYYLIREDCDKSFSVLPHENAVDWIKGQSVACLNALRDAWRNCSGDGAAWILAQAGMRVRQRHERGFKVDHQAVAFFSALCRIAGAKPAGNDFENAPEALWQHALDLAELEALPYELEARQKDVVAGLSSCKTGPAWHWTEPVPLWRRDATWERFTRAVHGELPEAPFPDEAAFKSAVAADHPDATILTLAGVYGFPGGALALHRTLQAAKPFYPFLTRWLRTASPAQVSTLREACDLLYNEASRDLAEGNPLWEVDWDWLCTKARAAGVDAVLPLMHHASSTCIVPVLFPLYGTLLVPHEYLNYARMYLSAKVRADEVDSIRHRASKEWELICSRIFAGHNFETTAEGIEIVGIDLRKNDCEVDGIAWNDDRVVLLSCKYEMEEPGAWRDAAIERRVEKISDWIAALAKKIGVATQVLTERTPRAWHRSSRTWINLPADLLQSRSLEAAVLSARIEPEIKGFPDVIWTVSPPLAAEVLERRMTGVPLSPWWNTDHEPPEFWPGRENSDGC